MVTGDIVALIIHLIKNSTNLTDIEAFTNLYIGNIPKYV